MTAPVVGEMVSEESLEETEVTDEVVAAQTGRPLETVRTCPGVALIASLDKVFAADAYKRSPCAYEV